MTTSRKVLLIAVLLIAAATAYVAFFWMKPQQLNDPFLSLSQVNAYLEQNFGFSFRGASSTAAPIALFCNSHAPLNPTQTVLHEFTYCQNNGLPVKIALAWTQASVNEDSYLNRIANTVMKAAQKDNASYACFKDKSFPTTNHMAGTLYDCRVSLPSGGIYYYSALFFAPPTHPEVGQVIYVYDVNTASEQTVVTATIRQIASALLF